MGGVGEDVQKQEWRGGGTPQVVRVEYTRVLMAAA